MRGRATLAVKLHVRKTARNRPKQASRNRILTPIPDEIEQEIRDATRTESLEEEAADRFSLHQSHLSALSTGYQFWKERYVLLILSDRAFRNRCFPRISLSVDFQPERQSGVYVLLSDSIRWVAKGRRKH